MSDNGVEDSRRSTTVLGHGREHPTSLHQEIVNMVDTNTLSVLPHSVIRHVRVVIDGCPYKPCV